jgi:hypothetical protein
MVRDPHAKLGCKLKAREEDDARAYAAERSTKWAGMADREQFVAEPCGVCHAWHVKRRTGLAANA